MKKAEVLIFRSWPLLFGWGYFTARGFALFLFGNITVGTMDGVCSRTIIPPFVLTDGIPLCLGAVEGDAGQAGATGEGSIRNDLGTRLDRIRTENCVPE